MMETTLQARFAWRNSQLFVLVLLLLTTSITASANQSEFTLEQQLFLDAEKALKAKDYVKYKNLITRLEHSPLIPYLEFLNTSQSLDRSKKVKAFLNQYPDSYLAHRLTKRWLSWLGKNRKWPTYLKVYDGQKSEELQCYLLHAKLDQYGSKNDEVKELAQSLWLSKNSVHNACDQPFVKLEPDFSTELRWKRISMALNANKLLLAKYLAKKLPQKDQKIFHRWVEMYNKPESTLTAAKNWHDKPLNREIISTGILRYSRKDTVAAWQVWKNDFRSNFDFTFEQTSNLETKLALRAGWRHLPEASHIYKLTADELLDAEAREWRVRTAIRARDWPLVMEYIELLPPADQDKEEWQYWKSRAMLTTENAEVGLAKLENLAQNTSYYGFMASDQLGSEYTFKDEPVINEKASRQVKLMAQQPVFQRIKSLYDIGRERLAHSEWRFEIDRLSTEQKRVAARLAHNWQWHFTAIVTTAKAKHFSDLDLRFPLMYDHAIQRESRRHNIRPSLILGVIRRESAFRPAAVSPAGAIGLMQVMPRTAKMMSKKLGIRRFNRQKMKDPEHSIKLGTSYLRQVLDQYNGHEALAAASYNAGPHRVKKWLPETETLDADIWVDTITFDETRKYVKAVLFYSTIFDWKTDGKVDYTLKSQMRPVKPLPRLENNITAMR